jgi:hypothetical protein
MGGKNQLIYYIKDVDWKNQSFYYTQVSRIDLFNNVDEIVDVLNPVQ